MPSGKSRDNRDRQKCLVDSDKRGRSPCLFCLSNMESTLAKSIKGTRALGYFRQNWLSLVILISFCIGSTVFNLLIVSEHKGYLNALQSKKTDEFYSSLLRFLVLLGVAMPLFSYKDYYLKRLAINWRLWLANRINNRYMAVHYTFNESRSANVDNPDERITGNAATVCSWLTSFVDLIVGKIFAVLGFSSMLYHASPLLCFIVVAYAAIGSIITVRVLGERLHMQNKKLKRAEADLRYAVSSIREFSESIAFYRGENVERQYIDNSSESVREMSLQRYATERLLGMLERSYNFLAIFLPIIVVAPRFFRNEITYGEIATSSLAFRQLLSALGVIVANLGEMSEFQGAAHRIGEMFNQLDKIENLKTSEIAVDSLEESISIKSLVLMTPEAIQISEEINFDMNPQCRSLLIQGSSGAGKTTLLRLLAGMWKYGIGRISMPPREKCFFLSQHPYMARSCKTLRENLCYPGLPPNLITDEILIDLMAQVGLRGKSLDLRADFWERVLSVGERQRVSFIRGLLQVRYGKISWLFLDEATSSMDSESERKCYELLLDTSAKFVSVGHKETINQYHEQVLQM